MNTGSSSSDYNFPINVLPDQWGEILREVAESHRISGITAQRLVSEWV